MDQNLDMDGVKEPPEDEVAHHAQVPLSIAPVGNGGSRLTGGLSQAPVTGPGKGAIRTRLYRDGVLVKENFPAEDISEQLQHKGRAASSG